MTAKCSGAAPNSLVEWMRARPVGRQQPVGRPAILTESRVEKQSSTMNVIVLNGQMQWSESELVAGERIGVLEQQQPYTGQKAALAGKVKGCESQLIGSTPIETDRCDRLKCNNQHQRQNRAPQ